MASRGQKETTQLRANVEDQINRLISQLKELEDYKEELDDEEYETMKKETMSALEEYNQYLLKMLSGDVTLVDEIGVGQLAIQAAISNAFQTPEIISLFAKKQPQQLRVRLAEVERDYKIGSMDGETYKQVKSEILSALQRLGDRLLDDERCFLQNNSSDSLKEFNKVSHSQNISESSIGKIISSQQQQQR